MIESPTWDPVYIRKGLRSFESFVNWYNVIYHGKPQKVNPLVPVYL